MSSVYILLTLGRSAAHEGGHVAMWPCDRPVVYCRWMKPVAWGVVMVLDKPLTMLLWHAGHINFNDEVSAAMRLADGVLLVVDAAEGVMMVTDKVIKQAVAEGLPICLLLSKVGAPPVALMRLHHWHLPLVFMQQWGW